MAIKIIGVKREGDIRLRSSDRGNILEYTEKYIVLCDNVETNMLTVIQNCTVESSILSQITYAPNTGLPVPRYSISAGAFCICTSLDGTRNEKNPKVWEFTAQWSSESAQKSNTDNGQPPAGLEDVVAQRETLYDVVKRYRVKDYGNRPYINAAGSLYNPALEVDEEIARWDFTQFEPMYTGGWSGGLPTAGYLLHDVASYSFSSSQLARVVPPGIYSDTTYTTMIGVTDNTVAFFNGAINLRPFKGCGPFTLKLEVRKSVVGWFYGQYGRMTDYSLKRDPKNWLDKPINAGPYFIGPAIKADGTYDDANFIKYDYIYYTKDQEDSSANMSQEEAGPLGYYDSATPGDSFIGNKQIKLFSSIADYDAVWPPGSSLFDRNIANAALGVRVGPELNGAFAGSPRANIIYRNFSQNVYTSFVGTTELDAQPLGGYKKVKTVKGSWTLRALRPPTNIEWPHIEYLGCQTFDFNGYLRVRYTN